MGQDMERRHLLGIRDLDRGEIQSVLEHAKTFMEVLQRPIPKVPALRGKTIVMLFLEPSTRTRISFEMAAKRLSADTVSVSKATSSIVKGEDLIDTVKNIRAMKADCFVIRHRASGAPHFIAHYIDCPVVNAGDGTNEHPTQALLDCLTIKRHFGGFKGLRIAILGDIMHSRVARSDIMAFKKLGAECIVAGPGTMLPPFIETLGARRVLNIKEAVKGADCIICLRIQKERQEQGLFPSEREYASCFGLSPEVLEYARPEAVIMHPGPVNKGVELSPELINGPRSLILRQVTAGVAVRMAVLMMLLAGSG